MATLLEALHLRGTIPSRILHPEWQIAAHNCLTAMKSGTLAVGAAILKFSGHACVCIAH